MFVVKIFWFVLGIHATSEILPCYSKLHHSSVQSKKNPGSPGFICICASTTLNIKYSTLNKLYFFRNGGSYFGHFFFSE